jgi:hypothetical protein
MASFLDKFVRLIQLISRVESAQAMFNQVEESLSEWEERLKKQHKMTKEV